MRKYETTAVVDLFGGLIGLSEEQAARRARNLKPVKKGVYEIVGPVQFKAGELISLDKPDKATAAKLEWIKPQPKPDPAP